PLLSLFKNQPILLPNGSGDAGRGQPGVAAGFQLILKETTPTEFAQSMHGELLPLAPRRELKRARADIDLGLEMENGRKGKEGKTARLRSSGRTELLPSARDDFHRPTPCSTRREVRAGVSENTRCEAPSHRPRQKRFSCQLAGFGQALNSDKPWQRVSAVTEPLGTRAQREPQCHGFP